MTLTQTASVKEDPGGGALRELGESRQGTDARQGSQSDLEVYGYLESIVVVLYCRSDRRLRRGLPYHSVVDCGVSER